MLNIGQMLCDGIDNALRMMSCWGIEVEIEYHTWPNLPRVFFMRLEKLMVFTTSLLGKNHAFSCVYPSHGKRTWHIWPCTFIYDVYDNLWFSFELYCDCHCCPKYTCLNDEMDTMTL